MTSLPFSTLRHILSWFLCSLNRLLFLKMKQKPSSDAGLDIFSSSEVFVDPPRKPEESKFASLRKKKGRKKEGEEEENVESQILGLCSFRSVVDFKGTSGANDESADLSGQTHWAQRDTHTCTHTYTAWLRQFDSMRGGVFIFNKATLILGLTCYNIPFILDQ